jgi:uncharacterized protein YbaP (TraB family)
MKGLVIVVAGIIALLNAYPAFAQYPVLVATRGNETVTLVGSLHVGISDPVRAREAERLLASSSSMCLEFDPTDTASIVADANAAIRNPPGRSLSARVGPDIYRKVVARLKPILGNDVNYDAMTPFVAGSLLAMVIDDLRTDNLRQQPATSPDADLLRAASVFHRPVYGIERPRAVAASFQRIGDAEWSAYLDAVLHILDCPACVINYSAGMRQLTKLSLDVDASHRALHAAAGGNIAIVGLFDRLYFGQRNEDIAEAISAGGERRRCNLIALGIGHLGGKQGVDALLRRAGWTVSSAASAGGK